MAAERISPLDSWTQATEMDGGVKGPSPHGEAMLRSYTVARALEYGMAIDDFLRLDARVREGAEWVEVLEHLAEDNLARARLQEQRQRAVPASDFYLLAAACFRLAQAGAEEAPAQRLALYERQAEAFGKGVKSSGLDVQPLEFRFQDARHQGWFVRPDNTDSPAPCVLVWGGADGWCEAFWRSVPSFLACKLSVCLLELPGQGLARLRDGSRLRTDFTQMVSSAMDELAAHGAHPDRFGVFGHSMGGTLAMSAAAADARVKACVNNGGVWQRSTDDKYPRVTQRVGRMLGPEIDVASFYESLDFPKAIRSMPAQLLCVQGGKDLLVSNEQAQQITEFRGAHAASLAYWPDGVHCVYNHAAERNSIVTDWLAQILVGEA
ncbi:alpha/beta fold hydrolase [Polaromonas sp.]|uniref:alpha/beta hydrolase family protein n=1 Tax=Polaromonas sp. TaxID=1869339 RepID=UPI0025CCB393|nr:alpha/beta fold hydrolase [Polaromonas sp.]